MNDLYRLTLRAAVSAIAGGTIAAADYARACLKRNAQLEAQIGAWAWLDAERVMSKAEQADASRADLRAAGMALPPLLGIPVGIKDIIDTAGIPTRRGSPLFEQNIPQVSASVVGKLEQAGAYVMGKTVTAELAFLSPGKTRNPWNAAHTPGGSSSGSAAAMAAGFVPAAIGTQTNGSVIRPAAYCGVVGYKPSQGLIANSGIHPFSPTLDQVGTFTRSVADAALLASALVENIEDLAAAIIPLKASPRLGLVRSPVWHLATPAQQQMLLDNANTLRAAGALIDDITLPAIFEQGHAALRDIMLYEAAAVFRAYTLTQREQLSALLKQFLDEGAKISETVYRDALQIRAALQNELGHLMQRFDALITPPATGEAPANLESTGDPAFCTLWSLTGAPAMVIPVGLGERGLPLGLQIVGAAHDDSRLLTVAAWCEARLPFSSLAF